jgi:hypothetical protein
LEGIFLTSHFENKDISEYPTLHFNFAGGIQLDVAPSAYLIYYAAFTGYVFAIQDSGSESMTILGDPFFEGM